MARRDGRTLAVGGAILLAVLGILLFSEREEGPPEPAEETEGYRPRVVDLEPADGAVVRGTQAWVRWRSPGVALGTLRFRKVGEKEFRTVEAVQGEFLVAAITPLEPGATYEFQAENHAHGVVERSAVRRLTAKGGLAFDPERVEATVKRDYDQTVTLTLRSTSDEPIRVAAKALAQFEEVPLDVVGPGSVDQPAEVPPGGTLSLRLAVTAADATRGLYEVPVEAGGAYGVVAIRVENPQVRLALRVLREDPHTLAKVVEVLNEGEGLTDLAVRVVPPNDRELRVDPAARHANLAGGMRLEVTLTPVLYLEFESLSAEVECTAAGQSVRFPLEFRAPPGARLLGVRKGTDTRTGGKDWFCTNKPTTCAGAPGPEANGPEDGKGDDEAEKKAGEDRIQKLRDTYIGKSGFAYDDTGTKRKGPKSFDCSGFVGKTLEDEGYPDPSATGSDQGGCQNIAETLADSIVDEKDARPGDIILFDYYGYDPENPAGRPKYAVLDSSGNVVWKTYDRKQDGRADHCGFVSEVSGGKVTKVLHFSYSGPKDQAWGDAWTGYYPTQASVVVTGTDGRIQSGGQLTLDKFWTPDGKVYRPKKKPAPGECTKPEGCKDGGAP